MIEQWRKRWRSSRH